LTQSSNALRTSLQRLSSGLKINSGADGPAALVISEEQRAQITGLQAAIDNTSTGISVVQTTEGALNEINSLLDTIRGLALNSANSAVNDSNAQAANQAEVANALATIDRIAQTTQFGTKKVLDGSAGLTGASSNPNNVTVLKTAYNAAPGAYQVNVSTAAQQAVVTAGTSQVGNLANAEQLTINGVQINLAAGTSQQGVADAINAQTTQTGVVAEIFANAGVQSNSAVSAPGAIANSTTKFAGSSGATDLSALPGIAQLTAGDTFTFSLTKSSGGAPISVTYTYDTVGNGGDGKTLQDVANKLATAAGAGYTGVVNVDATGHASLELKGPLGATAAIAFAQTGSVEANGDTALTLAAGSTNNGATLTTDPGATSTSTLLNHLSGGNGLYTNGDSLTITGTNSAGHAVNGTVNLTANSTIGDVVNGLQAAFGSGYTASFTNGKFEVIDNQNANASQLAFSIQNAAANAGQDATDFSATGFTTAASALRLHTTAYGSAATISVQSNQIGAAGSTGIGTGILSNSGVDIAGDINGYQATGQGNVLIGSNADKAAGIAVQIVAKNATYDTETVTGANLATVTVQNNSLVFQIGANSNQTASLAVDNAGTTALGLGVKGSEFTNLNQINIQTQTGAQESLNVIDQAISDISTLRGRLGAFQANTLQTTANDLRTTLDNTTAAESTIRDTDYARETANFTKYQVLVQAGTTVLSNANKTSQLVLALLQNA
jgi:flagellin